MACDSAAKTATNWTLSSAVPGPLVVNVPQGTVSVISFGPLNNGAIVALYNQTAVSRFAVLLHTISLHPISGSKNDYRLYKRFLKSHPLFLTWGQKGSWQLFGEGKSILDPSSCNANTSLTAVRDACWC